MTLVIQFYKLSPEMKMPRFLFERDSNPITHGLYIHFVWFGVKFAKED